MCCLLEQIQWNFWSFFFGTLSLDDAELKQNLLIGNGISWDGWCQTGERFCVMKRSVRIVSGSLNVMFLKSQYRGS